MASNFFDQMRDQLQIATWHNAIRNGIRPRSLALAELSPEEYLQVIGQSVVVERKGVSFPAWIAERERLRVRAEMGLDQLPKDGPVFGAVDPRIDDAWQRGY